LYPCRKREKKKKKREGGMPPFPLPKRGNGGGLGKKGSSDFTIKRRITGGGEEKEGTKPRVIAIANGRIGKKKGRRKTGLKKGSAILAEIKEERKTKWLLLHKGRKKKGKKEERRFSEKKGHYLGVQPLFAGAEKKRKGKF